jgi:hypothetical protein
VRRTLFTAAPVIVAGVMLAMAAPAHGATAPALSSVTIMGEPVVGGSLHAVVAVTGDPAPVIEYEWARCEAGRPSHCEFIRDATADTYVPVDADEGSRLIVRVTAANSMGRDYDESEATAAVRPPMPATGLGGPAYVLPEAPLYLRPFPVVRVRGTIAARGVIVTLLRVTAPRKAKVSARCAGGGCPVERLAARPGRIRPFERFLRAGIRITIRVRRAGYVGKYVRLTVRAGERPARRDACVVPGSSHPVACPRA